MPSLKHDYDRLENDLVNAVPGASVAGINQALFSVFKDFFDYTGSWEEDINVAITSGETEFELISDKVGEIYQLSVVRSSAGFPINAWLSQDRTQLVLRNAINTNDTFTATVKKTVGLPITREARSEIPDYILPIWGPVIFDGALARLFTQKNKAYHDLQASMLHLKRYEDGKRNVRSAVRHGHTYSSNTWRFPNGWRTRTQRNSANWTPPQ